MAPTKRATQDDLSTAVNGTAAVGGGSRINTAGNNATSAKAQGKKPAHNHNAPLAATKDAASVLAAGLGTREDHFSTGGVSTANGAATSNGNPPGGIKAHVGWRIAPLDVLSTYRWGHRMPTSLPHHHAFYNAILTNKGIGRHSPTSVARMRRRRAAALGLAGTAGVTNGKKATVMNGGGAKDTVMTGTTEGDHSAAMNGNGPDGHLGAGRDAETEPRFREEMGVLVRKHFNSMPAEENAITCELIYKVHNQDRAFRLRSIPKRPSASANG